ncbi:MAG: TetR family transcriptional regulator [Actinobacteria bacterium]|jgi:AcrR family transcriptional regulator|nr:MAG: TetR family transcriptional regulator [Actinomycetota bacterium]
MEAATSIDPPRELPGEKASLIVEAMRSSVAARGIAGSTFDHVAREAGVSRGLLHYYFGTKERLLVEVVRRECDVTRQRLERGVSGADSVDDVLAALVQSFEDFIGEGPSHVVTFYEILTLAQRNHEIAAELAELGRQVRVHLGDLLRAKADAGVLSLDADPEAAAGLLMALADGLTVRMLSEPELDIAPLMELAVSAARGLLA